MRYPVENAVVLATCSPVLQLGGTDVVVGAGLHVVLVGLLNVNERERERSRFARLRLVCV